MKVAIPIVIALIVLGSLSGCVMPEANTGKIQKYLCFIGYNSLNTADIQQYVATHFDAVACSFDQANSIQNIKNINPEVDFYAYYSATDEMTYYADYNYIDTNHEDWFMHSKYGSDKANRLEYTTSDGYTGYYMNPSSGWSDYYANRSATRLEGTQFTAIHADNAFTDWDQGFVAPSLSFYDLDDWDPVALAGWHSGMVNLLLKTRVAIQHDLIPNCWKSTDSGNASGMHEWEHFVHGPSHDLYAPGYTTQGWNNGLLCVEYLRSQADHGIAIVAISGTSGYPSSPTQADKDRLHQLQVFTLCCFLFAVEDMSKSYYTWCTNSYKGDPSLFYFPEMDFIYGNPVGEYQLMNGDLYKREFTEKTVFANLSPSISYEVETGSGTFTLPPRAGLIIDN